MQELKPQGAYQIKCEALVVENEKLKKLVEKFRKDIEKLEKQFSLKRTENHLLQKRWDDLNQLVVSMLEDSRK